MAHSPKAGRVTIPVVLLMLVMLLIGAYVVYDGNDSEELRGPAGARIGEVDEETLETDGGWHRHDWAAAEPALPELRPVRAPVDGPTPGDPENQDEVWDPQRRASERAFPDSPGDAGPGAPFLATEHSARIVSLSGERALDRAAACDVRVLPVRGGGFNCLVRVMCGGEVLYPNAAQTAGYVGCEVAEGQATHALDSGSTAEDTDPRIEFDLRSGTVTVSDEGDGVQAFSATLQITE